MGGSGDVRVHDKEREEKNAELTVNLPNGTKALAISPKAANDYMEQSANLGEAKSIIDEMRSLSGANFSPANRDRAARLQTRLALALKKPGMNSDKDFDVLRDLSVDLNSFTDVLTGKQSSALNEASKMIDQKTNHLQQSTLREPPKTADQRDASLGFKRK
jgi:hypothetical protein